MDRKCENCGQFIGERDRFCKYCGCPAPANSNQKKPDKETLKSVEDKIQRRKTQISQGDFNGAGELSVDLIKTEYIGDRSKLKVKSFGVALVAAVIALAAIVAFFIVSPIEFKFTYAKVLLLFVFVAAVLVCAVVIFERTYNIKGLNEAEDGSIYIKRAGFAHDALFRMGESIYKLTLPDACELCDGEIKGDMHIEKIEDRFVAVCNYNRKHFWTVDPGAIVGTLGATIEKKEIEEAPSDGADVESDGDV